MSYSAASRKLQSCTRFRSDADDRRGARGTAVQNARGQKATSDAQRNRDAYSQRVPLQARRRELPSKPRFAWVRSMYVWPVLVLYFLFLGVPAKAADEFLVYFGTYTRGESKSEGIYAYRFNASSGKLSALGLAAETPNPSFLAIHPNGRFLYSVSELSGTGGEEAGAVSAFRIDKMSGRLTLLNKVPAEGSVPCHLDVDRTGKMLAVANYGNGSVSAFPVQAGGRLGKASSSIQHQGSSVNPRRQEGPHAHSVNFSLDNRFLVAADLGLDKVIVYRADPAKATVERNDPPSTKVAPGSGPRHFTFHPSGRYAYLINELLSTVTAFRYDARRGALSALQTISTLPAGFEEENWTAEVRVHPSGKFLYGSNRGHNSIILFSIDDTTGNLTAVEHVSTQGKQPRNFEIDPSGKFLFAANRETDNVVVFRIDPLTGRLSPSGEELEIPSPACVRFVGL